MVITIDNSTAVDYRPTEWKSSSCRCIDLDCQNWFSLSYKQIETEIHPIENHDLETQ